MYWGAGLTGWFNGRIVTREQRDLFYPYPKLSYHLVEPLEMGRFHFYSMQIAVKRIGVI